MSISLFTSIKSMKVTRFNAVMHYLVCTFGYKMDIYLF